MSRGMVKWNAFNALIDQGERLAAMSHDRKRQPMPLLSQEEKQAMDCTLQQALQEQKGVVVTYYNDGFFHQSEGMIDRIDTVDKVLIIAKQRYEIQRIIRLELIQS